MDPAANKQPPHTGRPADSSLRDHTGMLGSDQGSGHRIPLPAGDQEWVGVDPEGLGLGSSVMTVPPS